ncbi:MAG: TMEM175 family protein [Planctomycetota bacterium]
MPEPTPVRRHQMLDRHFRWRSVGVTRLEGLSDGVFAIVLALLFLRAEPPTNFGGLMAAMKSLLPFAATFAIVVYIWFEQWLFSRRYDLRDGWTMFLQLLLLFLLLVYAYPLKFLFTMLTVAFFGPIGDLTLRSMTAAMDQWGGAALFVVYGIGYGSLFGVLALLYARAAALADALELDPAERLLTRGGVTQCLLQVGVALLSVGLAVAGPGTHFGLSGWIYGAIGPLMALHGVRQGRQLSALVAAPRR